MALCQMVPVENGGVFVGGKFVATSLLKLADKYRCAGDTRLKEMFNDFPEFGSQVFAQ